jgi:hypothetical protein
MPGALPISSHVMPAQRSSTHRHAAPELSAAAAGIGKAAKQRMPFYTACRCVTAPPGTHNRRCRQSYASTPCNKVCVTSYAKARATGFISTRKCVSRLQKCRQTIHIQAKCHTTPAPSQAAQYRISTSVSPAPTEHKKAGSEESCRVAALTAKGPTAMRTAQPHEPAARVLKHSMAVESPAQAHSLHKLSRHTNHAATAQTGDGSRHATAGNHKVASLQHCTSKPPGHLGL